MKKLLLMMPILLAGFCKAQTITLNDINSANVLKIMHNTEAARSLDDNSSSSIIQQIGNNNDAKIYDKAFRSNIIISQTGDFNNTLYINANRNAESAAKINIKGSNNYLDITGSNSISKDIKIDLQTNDKMIFMRNY